MAKYVLADVVAEIEDEHPSIEIDAAEETFVIPPPQLWDDEALSASQTGDAIAVARALLKGRYDAFVSAGGSAIILSQIIEKHGRAPVGESSAS